MDRLKSRKFWVTVATGAIVAGSKDLGIDPDMILYLCGVVSTYLAGQSYVDRHSASGRAAELTALRGGYSADREVDADKVIPPKGGSAVQPAKADEG